MRKVDFFVIGAMRAGTTTLQAMLARHPEIGLARGKEVDFFATPNGAGGVRRYHRHFDPRRCKWGEIAPNYGKFDIFPGTAQRIFDYNGGAQIFYILRDPVARALSQVVHARALGRTLTADAELLGSDQFEHWLNCSRYAAQISAFARIFPRQQIHILDLDDVLAAPEGQLNALCGVLGVSPWSNWGNLPQRNGTAELARLAWLRRIARQNPALRALWHRLAPSVPLSILHPPKPAIKRAHQTPPEFLVAALNERLSSEREACYERFGDRFLVPTQ